MAASPKEFREFAQDCLRWADETQSLNGTARYCWTSPKPGCKRHCSLNVAWHLLTIPCLPADQKLGQQNRPPQLTASSENFESRQNVMAVTS